MLTRGGLAFDSFDIFVDIFVGLIFYCVFAPFVAYGLLHLRSAGFRAQRRFPRVIVAAAMGWVTLPLGLSVASVVLALTR